MCTFSGSFVIELVARVNDNAVISLFKQSSDTSLLLRMDVNRNTLGTTLRQSKFYQNLCLTAVK